MAIEVRLLGVVGASRDGSPLNLRGARQQRLLAQLALAPGVVRSVDVICAAMWPTGDGPADPRAAVHTNVSRLRATLGGPSAIVARDGGYTLALPAGAVDVERFERLVASAAAGGAAAVELLGEALALWHGAALQDFAAEDWARPAAVRLEELRAKAVEDRAEALIERGDAARAVPELEAAALAEPLRDRTHQLLMVALHRTGRQAEALRVAQAHRRRLATDLGLEPSGAMLALEAAIAGGVEGSAAGRHGAAETGRLAALAPTLVDTDLSLSLLLAAEAAQRQTSPETLGALQRVLVDADTNLGFLPTEQPLRDVFFDGDDELVGFTDQQLIVWDARSHERRRTVDLPTAIASRAGVRVRRRWSGGVGR
jgi:DNA-binding SARP family transcriptional activator